MLLSNEVASIFVSSKSSNNDLFSTYIARALLAFSATSIPLNLLSLEKAGPPLRPPIELRLNGDLSVMPVSYTHLTLPTRDDV